MAFDKLAIDYPSVTGREAGWHAQALFNRAHVVLDMVVDSKAVVLQVADQAFAAAAIGVAMDVNGQRFSSNAQAAE